MRIRKTLCLLLAGTALASIAGAQPASAGGTQTTSPASEQDSLVRQVAARNWLVNAQPSPREEPPATKALMAFVSKKLSIDWTDTGSETDVEICAANFHDLAHDGLYRLVASIDVSGRLLCNRLVVVGQSGQAQDLNAWNIGDAAALAALVNTENGTTRLIVPELWWAPAGLGTCVATWIRVYAWHGNALADVSQANRAVYEARLQSLTQKIDRPPAMTNDADAIVNQSCAVMEKDRIEHFLGGNAEAGLKHAEAWMSNRDYRLRSNACALLADISRDGASNRAKADLEKLSQDNECAEASAALQTH
jgi:hypothetical protein